MRKKKYIIEQSEKNRQWFWRIVSSNGNIICTGGETYYYLQGGAMKGMKAACNAFGGDWNKIKPQIKVLRLVK